MATQGRVTPDGLLAEAKRPCVVVAHPDDEVLWCAGLIIHYPKDWLIVCCTTPFKDPERANKFMDSCDVLGAESLLLNHPERDGRIPKPDLTGRDLIISHGPNGEYGHPQHKELHELLSPDAWFAYGGISDFTIKLTDDEWKQKLSALKCYDGKSPVDNKRQLWETLLEYFGKRFDLRREPYGIKCLTQ